MMSMNIFFIESKDFFAILGNSYLLDDQGYERQYARNTSSIFQFLKTKGHKVVSSVPLVVKDDPHRLSLQE